MPGPQALLSNLHNALRDRPIAASVVRPVTHSAYPLTSAVRQGLGRVEIGGGYTGQSDSSLDIRIVTGAGTTPRVSEPVYIGPGSHRVEEVSADIGVSEQTVTLTLLDAGTDDRAAAVAFYGVTLRAKTPGAGGDNLHLTVDATNGAGEAWAGSLGPITRTPSNASVLDAIPAGTRRLVGSGYNFGGRDLTATGELHPDNPRIQFGTDPQVYRQYRAVESGEVVWYFGQETAREIEAGTLVYTLSGAYCVTLTDGVATERYSDVITLFDLLVELLASDLVEVDGIVLEDRTPTGMASDELPLRTSPTVLRTWGTGSDYATQGGQDLSITPVGSAPTETVTFSCIANEIVGRERWSARGTVSGSLGTLTTGLLATLGPYRSLIPVQTPEAAVVADGEVSFTQHRFGAETPEAEQYPILCEPLDYLLGANATSKTLTFTYTKRPSNLCDCSTVTLEGGPNAQCLGIEVETSTVTSLATGHAARLADLTTRQRAFLDTNRSIGANGELATARLDQQLATSAYNILRDGLTQLYTNADTVLEYPAWTAATAINRGEIREPTTRNGYLYRWVPTGEVNTASTGGTEPTWPTTVDPTGAAPGSTVPDNGGDWVCVALTPEKQWDALLSQVYVTDLAVLEGSSTSTVTTPGIAQSPNKAWQSLTTFNAFDRVPGGEHVYGVQVPGSSSDQEPSWGAKYVNDGSIVWERLDPTETTTSQSNGLDDINTQEKATTPYGISGEVETYVEGYKAAIAELLSWAGIDPGKLEAGGGSSTGVAASPCWSDPGDDYYWEVQDDDGLDYLPYFTNRGWHSARAIKNPETGQFAAQSSQEVWLGIRIACEQTLEAGDEFRVRIGNVNVEKAYQPGDTLRFDVVGGESLYLQGGQSGSNQTRWGVTGSVAGRLTDYVNLLGSEADYNLHGLHFTLYRTGRARTLGEQIRWSVELGQWQYSTDGGNSWSALAEIPASGAVAVTDGLTAEFIRGPAPSFVDGDLYSWQVRQPHAPDHLLAPGDQRLRLPDSSPVTYTITLLGTALVEVIALALHTLPSDCTVTATLRDGGAGVLWTGTLAWSQGPMLVWLDTPVTPVTLELTVTNAPGAWIGWLWAGRPFQTTYGCSDAYLSPAYLMGGQTDGRQLFFGAGQIGEFSWDRTLSLSDLQGLFQVMEHSKRHNNEPLLAVVDDNHLDEVAVVRIAADRTQVNTFEQNWRADRDGSQWAYSLRLPFAPVYSR